MRRIALAACTLFVLSGVVFVWRFSAATTPDAVRLRLAELAGARVVLDSVEPLWWSPGIVIRQLHLQTPSYSLRADRVDVRFAFLPLLQGRADPRSLALSDARLELTEKQEAAGSFKLPRGNNWVIRRLEVWAPVEGEQKLIFYLNQGSLSVGPGRTNRLSILGGATADEPASIQIQGEAGEWQPPALPSSTLRIQVRELPAQPLLGYLFGDQKILAKAKLDGAFGLAKDDGHLTAEGTLQAAIPAEEEVVTIRFRARARGELVVLEALGGQLAGNWFEASGQSRREQAGWNTEIEFRLPEGHLDEDTLRLLRQALGREILGVADNLRGRFSTEGKFVSSAGRERLTGQVELQGLIYTAEGLPALEEIRGGLRLDGQRVKFEAVTAKLFDAPVRLGGEVHGEELALSLETDQVPLSRLPLPSNENIPVRNILGTLHLQMAIGGRVYEPVISGLATFGEAGFDFRDLEVRGLEGQASFAPQRFHVDKLRGRAGSCDFELSGEFAPAHWRETLTARLAAPACEVSELLRLGQRGGIETLTAVQPGELTGPAALTVDYQDQQWRAVFEVDQGRWHPAWLGSSVESIRARIEGNPAHIEVRHLTGQLGLSPLSLRGRIGLLGSRPASWDLALEAELGEEDVQRLLHGRGLQWLRFPGAVAGDARLSGSRDQGIRLEARFRTHLPANTHKGNSTNSPEAVPSQIELRGLWTDNSFALERFAASLGSADLMVNGSVRLSPEKYFDLDLKVPPTSALADLLAFTRLPEALSSLQGTVAANVAMTGPPQNLDFRGTIDLEEGRLPGFFPEPVSLKGQVELSKEGFHLRDIAVLQPQGMLNLSGLLRPRGPSELRLIGAWVDLDQLLRHLPERRLSQPKNGLLTRHPLRVGIEVDRVQFLGVGFTQVEGEFEQAGGKFRLRVPRFSLGRGHGTLDVRPDNATDRIHASVQLEEIAVEALMADLLKLPPTLRAPLSLRAGLTGPVGSGEEFLKGAEGEVNFSLGRGRIRRGTLPERLFALAVLLREGFYGFSFIRLGRSLAKPRGLRRFREWTGRLVVGEGKARLEESHLAANVYDVNLGGEVNLENGAFRLHGEGDFHPGWEFDISLKSIVEGFARLFRLRRGRTAHRFEFDVGGTIGGRKSVENFRFKD